MPHNRRGISGSDLVRVGIQFQFLLTKSDTREPDPRVAASIFCFGEFQALMGWVKPMEICRATLADPLLAFYRGCPSILSLFTISHCLHVAGGLFLCFLSFISYYFTAVKWFWDTFKYLYIFGLITDHLSILSWHYHFQTYIYIYK